MMLLALLLLTSSATQEAAPIAGRPGASFELIAAARADVARDARTLWSGWHETPFGVLLIDGDQEHLLCHPRAVKGFSEPRLEPSTGCEQRSRARQFAPGLLATMPAFGLPSTIVVGTPAATNKSAAAWRATLIHEHFHQHQSALPRYYERVNALGLSRGDRTGMWMLNYPFPYADDAVGRSFSAAASTLRSTLESPAAERMRSLRRYLQAREALAAAVSTDEWRYFEFQLWQEGVARWTEIAASERSSDPTMREVGHAQRRAVLAELAKADLRSRERGAVYAFGAGEAMLLERCGPRWRARYPAVMSMGPLLHAALEDCGAPARRPS